MFRMDNVAMFDRIVIHIADFFKKSFSLRMVCSKKRFCQIGLSRRLYRLADCAMCT